MSEKKKTDSRGHWMKPLKGGWRPSHHLLLWVEEKRNGRRVETDELWASHLYMDKSGNVNPDETQLGLGKDLEFALDRASAGKGTLTIWLPGGWDHLVLSGLASLIDDGAITWRYCSIESHRVLIRGLWRGKSIVITSLSNWTGSTWDGWREKVEARGVELFAATFTAVAGICYRLGIGSIPPSAGAAGMLLWRRALGPQVTVMTDSPAKKKKVAPSKQETYIAPLPSRPVACRHAERHCAYGLVHRQMREGMVEGPIYCVDFREAYLCGLMNMAVPVGYTRTLHRPNVLELAQAFCTHTGCSLVHLRSPERPYPVRKSGRTLWATGEYWTWLAGTELASALTLGHVLECETAYLWADKSYSPDMVAGVLSMGNWLKENAGPLEAAAWRSVYSQMIGRFAARRKRWVDAPSHHNFGRWATWHGIDAETGIPVSFRSIAGKTQRLASKEDAGDSVTLIFSCVTATTRHLVIGVTDMVGHENVIAIEADAVWVNQEGWQRLLRRCSEKGIAPDRLQCKEVFQRAWLTGQSIALVEIDGKRYFRCPGVPADIAVGQSGVVAWEQGDEWHREGGPNMKKGVRRFERKYSAEQILKAYSRPAKVLPFADELIDPMLSEALLQPLDAQQKGVFDGQ